MRILVTVLVPLFYLASVKSAWAYIDPGTGSMILQAVLAGVAAGLVVFSLWWSKIKTAWARMKGRTRQTDARG